MRDLLSLPIPSRVRLKLLRAGFETGNDLRGVKVKIISTCAEISENEARAVLQALDQCSGGGGGTSGTQEPIPASSVNACQLLMTAATITTLCGNLDRLLNGGLPVGKITEICGMPGTGKTQLCLQLLVSVHLPKSCGGLCGEAIYVDTEGGFTIERLVSMAMAAVEHFQVEEAFATNPVRLGDIATFSVDGILKGTYYISCLDRIQLIAVVNVLDDFIAKHPFVHLIVVDSIAFHMHDTSYSARTGLLFRLSQRLSKLAVQRSLAVVLTNQMTTRIAANRDAYNVPALGNCWSHACPTRVLLTQSSDQRSARICKSSWLPDTTASFKITKSGIRDEDDAQQPSTSVHGYDDRVVEAQRGVVDMPSTSYRASGHSMPSASVWKRQITTSSFPTASKRPRSAE